MTDRIDTAALRALLDKATQKATPWEVCDGPVGYQHRIYTTTPETTMAVVCDVVRSGNAALIAAAINALPELLRVYQAVADAPEVWAGCRNGQWFASADWRAASHVKFHLSGFGTEDEQARITTTTRVRLVPSRGGV